MYPGTFAATTPHKPAVVMADSGETLTYAELDERSVRLSRVLHDAGLRPGDDVALLSENSLAYYEVFWAAMRSGLYVTAINQHLTASEISYIVGDCGARALVVSTALSGVATELLDSTPGVTVRLAVGGGVAGYHDYDAALAAASSTPLPDQPRGKDMLYSSGTTGLPKGVKAPLPGCQVHEGGDPLLGLFGPLYGFDTDTVYLSPAPLYHAAPLRFGGMIHQVGGTVVVLPKFEPAAALAAIERYRVTHSQWVPTMFVRMLKLPEEVRARHDLSSHRVAVHAAAPCPVEVKQAMISWWGPILQEYYAATEAIGVTVIDSGTWLRHPGSVGRSLLGVLHICADDGRELPTGEVGLIYFEREVLPFAYHNDPEKTAKAQHPEHPNWGTTGDVGYLDEDGFLFLTDRQAFMIISGGVNIYPQEVENALTLHPAVFDLAVIGIPDDEMGELVKAVVQPAEGVAPGPGLERELLEFLAGRIARFKVPRSIDFVTELPRTATGKLQKHRIRENYMSTPSTFTFEGRDGTPIVAYRWDSAGPARGVVQLTHGMGEYLLRYSHVAEALAAAGFLVVGQDHRGHGASAASLAEQGQIGGAGWVSLVDDIGVLVNRTHDEHPDLPLVLLGHSMGSFAVQQYLIDHSRDVSAAVLTGTAAVDLLESALDLDKPIDLTGFNAPFAPARTDFDWLSRDDAQVDAYVADPRCGFGLDAEAGKAMFAGARDAADPARFAGIRSDLPLYIAVGDQDPANGQLALVNALVARYEAAGLTDVTFVAYPGARHEIFNETNRDEVEAGLLSWIDRVVPR